MNSNRPTVDSEILLSEVLDEIMDRAARGESPDIEAYAKRYPDFADILRMTMPAVGFIHESSSGDGKNDDAEILPLVRKPPRQLGDFRLRRQIGRGGMGLVYEADQLSMDRRVAVKVLPFAVLADAKSLQRFKNEVKAAAALDHPNIVSVYSVGEENSVYFYAMQLIRGQNLAAVVQALSDPSADNQSFDDHSIRQVVAKSEVRTDDDSNRSESVANDDSLSNSDHDSPRHVETVVKASDSTAVRLKHRSFYKSVASLGIQAARALHYAHELGIVHRDIKPANLLLDENAALFVTDFGLASIEANAGATATGDVIGTLRYMPPEQALGKHELIDHRVDVYSLGMTLYELLTFRPAFEGRDRQELLRKVTSEQPQPPRKIQPSIPRELETIILKAISKERDERYASASDFADDLGRFIENQPILARPVSPLTRVRKWTQRNAVLVTTSLSLLLLATVVLSFILADSNQKERLLRQQAERQKERAESSLQLARETVDRMYLEVALDWIGQDRSLSDQQRELLQQASDYYQSLVNEMDATDLASKATAAVALQRIARISHHTERYPDAAAALNRSIPIWKELIEKKFGNNDYRESLRKDLNNLALAYNVMGRHDQAADIFADLQTLVNELQTESKRDDPQQHQNQANLYLAMAQSAFGMNDWDRTEEHLARAKTAIQAYVRIDPLHGDAYNLRARHSAAATAMLRRRGQLEEAEKRGQSALRNIQFMRTSNDDSRVALDNERMLTLELAKVYQAQGNFQEAAAFLEKSLAMSRRTFVDQILPAAVMSHTFFTPGFKMNDYLRPIAFCSYVNEQLRLASVLGELNRPHQAGLLLAEAERTMLILAEMYPDSPRYQVAKANTYTELGIMLAERRPAESELALRLAADAWHDAVGRVPEVESYQSGLRTASSDLDWFREQFPSFSLNADQEAHRQWRKQSTNETRFTGIYLLEAGLTEKAIRRLERSLEQNPRVPAFDWLYLAKANWKLGKRVDAESFFEKASDWIEINNSQDQELQRLHHDVAKELGSQTSASGSASD